MLQLLPVDLSAQAPVPVDPQNDLADLNYREMITLLGVPENFPNTSQINIAFDHHQPNYNNFY